MTFAPDDGDRVAVIYHSAKRSQYVAIDEATGRELVAATTPERAAYVCFEGHKAHQVKHCYLMAVPSSAPG